MTIYRPGQHLYYPGSGVRVVQPMGGAAVLALTLTATTTGAAQTVTIHRMTPAAGKAVVISWGDGNSTTVAAGDTASKANTYASAGSYAIRVTDARNIVQIDLHDSKLSGLKSAELAKSAITYFVAYSLGTATTCVVRSEDMTSWKPTTWYLYSMPAGTYAIDSADMAGWTPREWYLFSMPAGTYAIDSSDMALWTPTTFRLSVMPAGTYAIDFSDMASWTPTDFRLYSMPAGTYTINGADMAGWVSATVVRADGLGLLQSSVDAILWGLYQATLSRTVAGGTILVGGTNAAPSGTYQAAAACPVSVATPGKEVAHELQNDGCGAIAAGETWTTVTVTA
jgi:hypothetical protein